MSVVSIMMTHTPDYRMDKVVQPMVQPPTSHSSGSPRSPFRTYNLDPVPENTLPTRKKSSRRGQGSHSRNEQTTHDKRSDVGNRDHQVKQQQHQQQQQQEDNAMLETLAPTMRSPRSRPSFLNRDPWSSPRLGGPSSPPRPAATASHRRTMSDAQLTLERERQKMERSKSRTEWTIDLDSLEKGVDEWADPMRSRVILILGGQCHLFIFFDKSFQADLDVSGSLGPVDPTVASMKPSLLSADFRNTLMMVCRNPTGSPKSSSPDLKKSATPSSSTSSRQKLSRRLTSFTSSSSQEPASDFAPASSSVRAPSILVRSDSQTLQDLVVELGDKCMPEVLFLSESTKTLSETIGKAVDLANAWRKKRKASLFNPTLSDANILLAGSRYSPPLVQGDSARASSASHSPSYSRRESFEQNGSAQPGRSRPRSLSSLFGNTMSFAASLNGDSDHASEKKGSDHPKPMAFDAIINFMPKSDQTTSFQNSLQNLLVTTAAVLPFIPSTMRMVVPTESNPASRDATRPSSTISSSSARSRGSSPAARTFHKSTCIPQSLIHVVSSPPSGPMIKAAESYLQPLFPQTRPRDTMEHVEPRAYLLGPSVLGRPMKKAIDGSSVSGLGLVLSGAVSCCNPKHRTFLDDLRNCQFEHGPRSVEDMSNLPPSSGNVPTTWTPNDFSVAMGIVTYDSDLSSDSNATAARPGISPLGNHHALSSPISSRTPPLDFDGDTRSSFEHLSSLHSSREGALGVDTHSTPSRTPTRLEPDEQTIKKESGWIGKLFSKGTNRKAGQKV